MLICTYVYDIAILASKINFISTSALRTAELAVRRVRKAIPPGKLRASLVAGYRNLNEEPPGV